MQQIMKKITEWFDRYAAGFYGDDSYVNANIRLKENHSRRTCREMRYLARQMRLDPRRTAIAEIIGLLHDVGRFEQFKKFRTYCDAKSTEHCLLSVEVLRGTDVLQILDQDTGTIILAAIEHHGKKELPAGLNGDSLLMARMIRDADKLDALFVMVQNYTRYYADPDNFPFEVELPEQPGYSKDVIQAVLQRRQVDYRQLTNLNDVKLLNLAWAYDVNFTPTLNRILQRRLLETIGGFLPDTPETQMAKQTVMDYVISRVKSG